MNNIEFEKKLAENGFTGKEIAKLREIAQKDNESYQSLLIDLKKRFIRACLFLILFTTIYVWELIYDEKQTALPLTITFLFVCTIIYIITPLKTGFKSFIFPRK